MSLYNREELLKQTPTCHYYKASKNGRIFFMHEFHQIDESNEALFRMRRKLALVDHLVELVEDYEHKGMKYYISEYIEQNLQSLMDTKPGGVLDLSVALELYASLLKTLAQFHKQKVVLRALKPRKLRVKKGEVYFYDLSQAQTIKRKQNLFAENYFNPFIAPEIFAQDGYGQEVDVWASGVLLFYLLTRRYPFEAKDTRKSYEEQFHNKCQNGFNFIEVVDKMGIKVSPSLKSKFGLIQLFRGIFQPNPKHRKTIDDLMQNPLLKIYFQKGLMSKILEHPDSELFASIFHPKINKQKKSEQWAIYLHKEEILLDFIENSSSSLLNDSPDIFSQNLRYRTQLAVLKVALIKCNALIEIFYGRRAPFFPIDKQQWQKLRKSETIGWAKQKFQKKMKIFEELYVAACKHTSPKDLIFLSAIPPQFQDIKSSYRHQLSDMYKIGRQGLTENKSNPELKRRLIENMVRVIILFLINRLFEEEHKADDFSSYLKWSSRKDFSNLEDWIESEEQSVLREFVIKITNKYLKGSEE